MVFWSSPNYHQTLYRHQGTNRQISRVPKSFISAQSLSLADIGYLVHSSSGSGCPPWPQNLLLQFHSSQPWLNPFTLWFGSMAASPSSSSLVILIILTYPSIDSMSLSVAYASSKATVSSLDSATAFSTVMWSFCNLHIFISIL